MSGLCICNHCGERFTKQGLNRHMNSRKCHSNVLCKEYKNWALEDAKAKDLIPVRGAWYQIIERAGLETVRLPRDVHQNNYKFWNEKVDYRGEVLNCHNIIYAERWAVEIARATFADPDTRVAALKIAQSDKTSRDHLSSMLRLTAMSEDNQAMRRQRQGRIVMDFVQTNGRLH